MPRAGGAQPSTKIFLEQVAIINNNLFINIFIRRSPAHRAQYSLVVMKSAASPSWSNKRTRGPNEEAFQASVRRHLGQGRRRGRGEKGDENWRIQLDFFHSRFFVYFLVKVAAQ